MKEFWSKASCKEVNMNEQKLFEMFSRILEDNLNLHSILILKDGYKVVEVYTHPFDKFSVRDVFSVSKSFLSIAVGKAIEIGLLSLEDKVIDFFPDADIKRAEFLENLSIYNLLTMTSGHLKEDYMKIWSSENWVLAYLNTPITIKPGTVHEYNNFNSFILSVILEKVSGIRLNDFLYKHILSKMGIDKPVWSQVKNDYDFGASGLHLSLNDMAKFGQLLLDEGQWRGEQLINRDYINSATHKQVESQQWVEPAWSSLNYGYGFHIWMNSFGGFSARGMLGQDLIINREHDLVVAINGCYKNEDYELFDLVENYIIPACKTGYKGSDTTLNKLIKRFESVQGVKTVIPKWFIKQKRMYKLNKPITYPNVFTFIKTDLTHIGFEINEEGLLIHYVDREKNFTLHCGLDGKFIANSVVKDIGADTIDYRYALRGRFMNEDKLMIEIQPISHSMILDLEIQFMNEEKIMVTSWVSIVKENKQTAEGHKC